MWDLELQCKQDFYKSMERVYAWYDGEIIDRVPVRFSNHNDEYNLSITNNYKNLKDYWFDFEEHIDAFEKSLEKKSFLGETFPVYWPNLGPNVYASFFGCPIEFGEVTSWTEPILKDYSNLNNLKIDFENEYFLQLIKMTEYALERCKGKFMVGYTDLHPGIDCAAAIRESQELCFDMYDNREETKKIIEISNQDFMKVYDCFDGMLKKHNQLSVAWMNIPSFEKMHIPSADFSSLISKNDFCEIYLPFLLEEIKPMTHNIFHLDGKDVAKHIDSILEIPNITAIQWVQGVGDDKPIKQWIPLIKKIQKAKKGVVIDIDKSELGMVMDELNPKGIYLCINSDIEEEQKQILRDLEKWR